jgi:hypothetical protein
VVCELAIEFGEQHDAVGSAPAEVSAEFFAGRRAVDNETRAGERPEDGGEPPPGVMAITNWSIANAESDGGGRSPE